MYTIYDDIEVHVDVPVTLVNNQEKIIYLDNDNPLEIYADSGYTGLSHVQVTTLMQSKVSNLTSSGTSFIYPSEGFCGLDSVGVSPVLQSKTVNCSSNTQFIVTPDNGYCGLSDVSVNVSVAVVPPTYSYSLTGIDLDISDLNTHRYSVGNLNARTLSYYTFTSSSQIVYFGLFGSYATGYTGSNYSDRNHLKRLSYVLMRNDSGSSYTFNYINSLGYTPDFYVVRSINMHDWYSTLSDDVATSYFSSITYGFTKIDETTGNAVKSGDIRIKRTVPFETFGYQCGDLCYSERFGLGP